MTPQEVVQQYLARNYRVVFWPQIGDIKGPKETGWPNKQYTLADYREGCRVGIITGTEISPDHFLHDVDIDWSPGSLIAQALLPPTSFVFGRPSKRVSHCIYTTTEALASYRYEDIDKTCLIELRGTKNNGDIGLQTMVPPSIWSKGALKEALTFIKGDGPDHIENPTLLKQRVCLSAIGMILAKNFGTNGFGHEPRLAFAGFLLRAGVPVDDIVIMGESISIYCNNREVHDVKRAVESTAAALAAGHKKTKGGPALAKLIGDKGKLVIARINEWLGRDSDFIRDREGIIIRDNQENIARALTLLDVSLSYHEFNERVTAVASGKPATFDDAFIDHLWLRVDRELRFRPTFAFFEKVIRNIAHETSYHAVRDYLQTLTWDKLPRLDTWLIDYAGADDTPYIRAVSSIVLIAAVKRVRLPGCKYDEMLILESGQGMNKSSALRALCPDETWFSDDLPLNVDAKQIIERTLGKWIIEASDLAGKRGAENEHLKSMLSRQVDGPARLAYARNPVERHRQFIMIGTTNSAKYLKDSTGARRFWPVKVSGFQLPELRLVRDQLWAEASTREALGASIRLPEELWPHASDEQEQRLAHDAWEDLLRSALLNVAPSHDGKRRIATDVLWEALGIEAGRRDRAGSARIVEIMERLGFRSTTVRLSGEDPQRGYITDDERKLTLVAEHELDDVDGLGQNPNTPF